VAVGGDHVGFIVATAPIFIALLATLFLHERLRPVWVDRLHYLGEYPVEDASFDCGQANVSVASTPQTAWKGASRW